MRAFAPSLLAAVLPVPFLCAPLAAQTPAAPPAASPAEVAATPAAEPAPTQAMITLPALTPVRIEIMETMNSQASRIGARFPIRLASPIDIPGGYRIDAGITGWGEVVHAAKSRFGGKPGELILAVRYLDFGSIRIPLRSLKYDTARGLDNTDTAAAVGIAVGMAAMFITGGEVNIPAGTVANAKTSAPVTLDVPAPRPSTPSVAQGDSKP